MSFGRVVRPGRPGGAGAAWCALLLTTFGAATAAWADTGSLAEGSLVAWGRNTNGECNVPSGYFVQISAGGVSGLALRNDGNVVAWGGNADGQLNVPAGKFIQVSAAQGGSTSMALRSDGNIAAWGYNGDGECNVPTGVFTQLSAGGSHGLAIRSNGTLAAWGYNQYGEANAPAGATYTQVSGGFIHSLALRSDGNIAAWGVNTLGECNVPAGSYTQVSAGLGHSLALRSNGSIAAWGDNGDGQCNAPAGNNFTQVSAGDFHSLALRSDGNIVAWGNNAYGECNVPSGFYLAASAGWSYSLGLKARTSYQDLLVSGTGTAALLQRSITVSGNATVQSTLNTANNPTMTLGGKLLILSTGTVNLQGGALVGLADPNVGVPIVNDGLLHVLSGSFKAGAVTNSDSNLHLGTTRIDANATLHVTRIVQDEVIVSGTLVLGDDSSTTTSAADSFPAAPMNPDIWSILHRHSLLGAAASDDQTAAATVTDTETAALAEGLSGPVSDRPMGLRSPAQQPVPEPASLMLLALGGFALPRRRRVR